MLLAPSTTVSEIKEVVEAVTEIHNGKFAVTRQEELVASVIDQLAVNCRLGSQDVFEESARQIWAISQYMGTPFTTPYNFLNCLVRDGFGDTVVPAINIDWIPMELLCSIMSAASEMEVGPLLLITDKSSEDYTRNITTALCAAIKTEWQGPVLFHDTHTPLPIDMDEIKWKRNLLENSCDVSNEALETLLDDSEPLDIDAPADNWEPLFKVAHELWETVLEELFDEYCDYFDNLEINDTFCLLKRYQIPRGVVESEHMDVILGRR